MKRYTGGNQKNSVDKGIQMRYEALKFQGKVEPGVWRGNKFMYICGCGRQPLEQTAIQPVRH